MAEVRRYPAVTASLDAVLGDLEALLTARRVSGAVLWQLVVAVEELFFTKNITTGIAVAHGRGVILLAAEKLGVPVEQVIFVDDNINAVKTASDAGMCTVGVYDESGADYREQLEKIADWYIASFCGLNQFFGKE